jgi:membrane dipeptidase
MLRKLWLALTKTGRRKLAFGLFSTAVSLCCLFFASPTLVARYANSVHGPGAYEVSADASKLHEELFVVDLHADSLLWNRDLLIRGHYGHVDVPRMIEGNLALQAFTIVTKVPLMSALKDNAIPPDVTIRALVMAQRWPRATWSSLHQRALYQTARLHSLASRSKGQFRVIQSRQDLERYILDRAKNRRLAAGFLGIEGGHCLEGKIENLAELFSAGVRMIGLTHFFDTELGGSAHGNTGDGLTDFGRQVLKRMESLGIVVDLSHASPAMIDDVLALAKKPVLVSHTGVSGTHKSVRNLTDEHIRGVAKSGGVIGIAFFKNATGGVDMKSIIAAIRYTTDLVGVDAVSLGSDFDGAVSTPIDSSQMSQLSSALLAASFSLRDVKKIMGGNVLRVLRQTLPSSKINDH